MIEETFSKADTDHGYTKIANMLLESISAVDLSGRQFRVLLSVIRKTYGFNQKSDYITASQIAVVMKYDGAITNINSDIRVLISRKILIKNGRFLGPNPTVSEWKINHKRDRNQSQKRSKSITKEIEINQGGDRNQSDVACVVVGTERHKEIEINQGGDRNQSQKVIKNDLHKRQNKLIQNTKDKNTCAADAAPEDCNEKSMCKFDDWWDVYPVKRNKKKSKDIWKRKKLNTIADDLILDVKNRVKSDASWISGYVPHPTTYLNGERWDDELTKPFGNHQNANQSRTGFSAFEKVRAGIEASRERDSREFVADDDPALRTQVGERVRGGCRPDGSVGGIFEGSFTRND